MYHFKWLIDRYRDQLLDSKTLDTGSWHSVPTDGNPLLVTMELPWVDMRFKVGASIEALQEQVRPNLPWAEDHFLERVDGKPMNPAPSHAWWPWNHAQHQDAAQRFSHTYPERFWPKYAGDYPADLNREGGGPNRGIRYDYGDLGDVVKLLIDTPNTRQAVLPVFFPEDTGNTAGVRLPCSLFYHFMYRDGFLDCHYTMRSCDFVRHFKDDVYMAARLLQWVAEQAHMMPGNLRMNIASLHAMEGDRYKMTEDKNNGIW